MNTTLSVQQGSWTPLIWLLVAAVGGFAIPAVFAGALDMERSWFLIPYVLLAGGFVAAYLYTVRGDFQTLIVNNWPLTVLISLAAGAFLVWSVLSQDSSPRATGAQLIADLLWQGGVYGIVDALLLSVFPVLIVWQLFGTQDTWSGRIGVGVLALLASALVTAAYHLGYAEFRGRDVIKPIFGAAITTLAFLLTRNPVAAVGPHVAMHVAAVLHGPATTVQLPPH